MSALRPPEPVRITLPPLSGAEALLLVGIFERAAAALWSVHGDSMTEFIRSRSTRPRCAPTNPNLCTVTASAARVPEESEISEQPQLAILATLEHAASSAINALKARYPELCNSVDPSWRPTTCELERAWSAMLAARKLCETLGSYGLELFPWSIDQDDDLPF
jgi:hypothetical protein